MIHLILQKQDEAIPYQNLPKVPSTLAINILLSVGQLK